MKSYIIKLVTVMCFFFGSKEIICATTDFTPYFEADSEFQQIVAKATTVNRMPRISKKQKAEFIYILSDSKRFFGSKTFDLRDLSSVLFKKDIYFNGCLL
ncbi:hypothetical protein Lnau_0206 [Legionella nautarum]|uniref:Uncharacterized protein n=1 Tax=Legionella nautarum TaxID=45070 RepID=A0A0W0X3K2_9GAMM|nr:hypothetical protein [Legionella nautarum]KTD39137.1 hypothetical protein Lnau_0206 [Legionella nautarum]